MVLLEPCHWLYEIITPSVIIDMAPVMHIVGHKSVIVEKKYGINQWLWPMVAVSDPQNETQ